MFSTTKETTDHVFLGWKRLSTVATSLSHHRYHSSHSVSFFCDLSRALMRPHSVSICNDWNCDVGSELMCSGSLYQPGCSPRGASAARQSGCFSAIRWDPPIKQVHLSSEFERTLSFCLSIWDRLSMFMLCPSSACVEQMQSPKACQSQHGISGQTRVTNRSRSDGRYVEQEWYLWRTEEFMCWNMVGPRIWAHRIWEDWSTWLRTSCDNRMALGSTHDQVRVVPPLL